MEEPTKKRNPIFVLYPNIIHAPAKEGDGRLCNAQVGKVEKDTNVVTCRKCLKKLGMKMPNRKE